MTASIINLDIQNKNQLKNHATRIIESEDLDFRGKTIDDMRSIVTELLCELNCWERTLQDSVEKVIAQIFSTGRDTMPKHSSGTSIVISAIVNGISFDDDTSDDNVIATIDMTTEECKEKYGNQLSTMNTQADKIRFLIKNVGYKPSFIRDVLGMKKMTQIVAIKRKMK